MVNAKKQTLNAMNKRESNIYSDFSIPSAPNC